MAADGTYPNSVQIRQDGNAAVPTGKSLDIESGGALKIAGTDMTTKLAAAVTTPVAGVAAGYKIARGVHTQVAASDTVVSGLATVVAVFATPATDLDGDAFMAVTADIGDQDGSPAAGSFYLKVWKSNGDGDATMVAATSFSQAINWFAIGT